MPTHAILGGTGATGSAILRFLLESDTQDLKINVYVRSRSKLLSLVPELEQKNTSSSQHQVNIFEGALTNGKTLSECLNGADVIYICMATNRPSRVTTIARDAATAVIAALKDIRETAGSLYNPPTVVINRSASQNTHVDVGIPSPMLGFFKWILQDIYLDLNIACDLYADAEKQSHLLESIIIDPPGLHDAYGTNRTGHKIITKGKMPSVISYADLGAGFVEVAQRRGEFKGQVVSIASTGKVRETYGTPFKHLLHGLRVRLLPF